MVGAQDGAGDGPPSRTEGEHPIDTIRRLMQVVAEATEGMSHEEIRSAIQAALADSAMPGQWPPWVREVFDDVVVYEWDGVLFRASYSIDEAGEATLGDAEEVRVTYTPVGQAEAARLAEAVDRSAWDGNAAMTACDDAACYRAICAGQREGDASSRSSWALPHHKSPDAAPNARAVRNALARLSSTEGLTNAEAAERHLRAHLTEIQRAEESAGVFDPHDGPTRRALVEALTGDDGFREEVVAVLERIDDGTRALVDLVESTPVATLERAVDGNGRARIKLIEPGWGSSGYYPRTTLERDGATAYPAGTKMYWNHPTRTEERERPEGDLDRLAAELTTDAAFDAAGSDGPGLYADAIVFEKFRGTVEELAPHIGVSIRGRGRVTQGTAEGKTGPIIDELVDGYSVDFVTLPGAGGKVAELFEAAGRGARTMDDPKEGPKVDDLKEAQDRADAAERERDEAKERAERAEAALKMAEARRRAAEIVAGEKLPAIVATRVVENAAGDPPVTDDGELDVEKLTEAVKAAAKAEREYIAKATGSGKVTGLGESADEGLGEGAEPKDDDDDHSKELESLAEAMGLGDDAAKVFVGGRS